MFLFIQIRLLSNSSQFEIEVIIYHKYIETILLQFKKCLFEG